MGRPSEYTQEIADSICEWLADGQSLRSICESDEMPNKSTVFKWLDRHAEFGDQYARAREAQADALADEITDIADESDRDTVLKTRPDGSQFEECNSEWIARSRLRVDARKWVASKLKPKKYGDKVEQTHVGDKERPVVLTSLDASI